MLLSREQLLKRRPRRTTVVEVPELGGSVTLRALTEGERSRYEMSFLNKKGVPRADLVEQARARLIVESAVDEQGNLLFGPDDVEALYQLDASITARLYDEARKLSGFEESDIESLAKNSVTPLAGDSPTDSR